MTDNSTILRSGKIIEKRIQDERMCDSKNTATPRPMGAGDQPRRSTSLRSARSSVTNSSTASRKRLLEARAARLMAELEQDRITKEQNRIAEEKRLDEERLQNEKALIEARLQEDLVELENDARSDLSGGSDKVHGWINDNNVQAENAPQDYERSKNDIAHLSHAITDAILKCSGSAPMNDKLIGRLSAKELPSFSGDALDWLRFKNAFETTTAVGKYSDLENVTRLQKCLHGEAWEAVAARLITVTSAEEIMKTLEMRFGRPDLVLHRMIGEIKRLPKLTGLRSELLILATKVSNCVAAIEATRQVDYMYSPELAAEVVNKLTEPLVYRWMDFWERLDGHQPRLSALAQYLMREAERVCKAGTVEFPSKSLKYTSSSKHPVLMMTDENEDTEPSVNIVSETGRDKSTKGKCIYCGNLEHSLDNCSTFRDLETNKRWDWTCEKKLCFKCLSSTHRRDKCRSKKRCSTCKRGHHSLLHRHDWSNTGDKTQKADKHGTLSDTTANVWDKQTKKVFLKILPIVVEGPKGNIHTYALLDEGSTVTLIERQVADKIGAEGPETKLNLRGAMGDSLRAPTHSISLILKTPEGEKHRLDGVRTVDKLTLPTQSLDHSDLASLAHLKNVPLQTFNGKPTLIIGQDYWFLIVSREVREGRKNEPVASLTRLGWVLHGFASNVTRNIEDYGCHVRERCDEDLHELVKYHFRLESIGIKPDNGHRHSSEERRALNILDTTSKNIGDRWEAGLLWRSDDVELPDNKRNAESRLKSIERNMDADLNFAVDYTKQVMNMLQKGYAEKVTGPLSGKRIWYLPHFGVRNPNKPGKLRLVFDAKATTNGISLNTELLSGPDLLNSLVGVLFRFRERAVAVSGDIREMFLQVKIISEDQKAQCFLWRGMERNIPPIPYKMTSMTFGATSSPCTATYILRRNAEDFASTHPRAVEAIKRRHYVDDYLDSADNEKEMRQLVADVTMIHKAGGFEIRGWVSNKPEVLPQDSDTSTVSLIQQGDTEERTLGLIWRPKTDLLGFDVTLKKLNKDVAQGLRPPTKREMLKVVMSIFDPLGFLCPIMIRGKIMLQDIWRSGVQWDQRIGQKASDAWFLWLNDVKKCQYLSVLRCYGFTSLTDLQLHVFADASEQAYATVAYIRKDGKVSFVAGKSRVAPLKSTTIPRLELQAAVMGSRLGLTVTKEHSIKIDKRFFWTDSQTVWWWINNNPKKKMPFVSNRLSEIDDLTRTEEWRWLPGNLNVADEATRANGNFESTKAKWIHGPEFLYLSEESWPAVTPQAHTEEEFTEPRHVAVTTERDYLIDHGRFSNWRRLLRSLATALLFMDKCKGIPVRLTLEHERRAEILIIREVQAESFPEDLKIIENQGNLRPSSRLRQLSPFLDAEGLLRVQSRIEAAADLPIEVKNPVILDGQHHVTRLIIEYKHRKQGHNNTDTLINEIRQNYYVLRLRSTVRSIIARCVICKAKRARCEQPKMAGLPPARLQHHCRPFTYCGIDLFGPMLVTIGRRNEKRWGVLFTCLNTRAVTIELAASLSTDSTILAIRRMAARRGLPKQIYSDNGTNFRGADKELRNAAKALLTDEHLADEATALGIDWRFNPPDAPHMGGVWERLVRSIKTSLYAILHSRAPKEEVLSTLIAEAENIVNSRPLTHISLDPNEEEALTPNHFLLGASNPLPRPGVFSDQDLSLRKQWRIAQRLTDHFWSRWLREYLPNLHLRKKWNDDSGRNVSMGDVVLIADSSAPRNVWPRGKVTATTPGRDGRVRIVDVATKGGILRRPVSKIVILLRAENTIPSASTTKTGVPQRGGDCN